MKMIKRVTSLVLALILVLSLSVTAFAADSSVKYRGHSVLNFFKFAPGDFTRTDLFDNFKGVMPGDTLTETITVSNEAFCCDFIKIFMRAVPHDEEKNDLSAEVKAAAKDETVATMTEFLNELTMTVTQDGKTIFSGKANELDGLRENVLLGKLRRNKSVTLDVTLTVPADLGNEYANRVGEVDWLFTVEEYDDARPNTPKTGDETNIMPYVALLAVGLAGMFFLLATKRKKQVN